MFLVKKINSNLYLNWQKYPANNVKLREKIVSVKKFFSLVLVENIVKIKNGF